MLKNYFKVAWRKLTRNKLYTFVNTLGLALGICACLVIWQIARYEFSFDRFHPDKERIYQVNTYEQYTPNDPPHSLPCVAPSFPAAIQKTIPGLETVAPYHILYDASASLPRSRSPQAVFPASPIVTGPEYFAVMKYDWLAGNEQIALSEPYKVVLSEKKAHLYFGTCPLDQVIGRELLYNDSIHVTVAGVVRDWGENTDFPYTEFISLGTIENPYLRQLLQIDQVKDIPSTSRVLLKLERETNPAKTQDALSALFEKNGRNQLMTRVALQPLSAIHFTGSEDKTGFTTAYLPTLHTLMSIALFILLLAVVNYVNLATAQSITRDKEIGVRKVLGSGRSRLIFQFLFETLLLTLFAVGVAALLVRPVLAAFHEFIPSGVQFHPAAPATLAFLTGIAIVTTLLAGLYPARVLSAYTPVISLRGSAGPKGSEKWWLRKGLIVFQFTISLIFIIATIVIGRQIRFASHSGLGFQSDAIVLLNAPDGSSVNSIKILEERIGRLPGVGRAARENMPPMGLDRGFFNIQYRARSEEHIPVAAIKADENFIPLYGIRLLAGRNLQPSDTLKELVINQSLSNLLGFKRPEEAVGQMLFTWNKFVPIVGVVADFHQASFHEAIKPQLITAISCKDIAVKLDTKGRPVSEARAILARIGRQWSEIYPHAAFTYSFLDESLAQLYKKEQTTAFLMKISTGITIFISCMGLFGLTMFMAEKRTREIGIRKVLGATVGDILFLVSSDFLGLFLLSFIIASPLAWAILHHWLEDFAYRIPLSWWLFFVAGAAATLMALITISYPAIKAALANPVKSLRSE